MEKGARKDWPEGKMNFDDWLKQYKKTHSLPIGAETHMRDAFIGGQADTLETTDPDNFDQALFILPPPITPDQRPGVSLDIREGWAYGWPRSCALWIIIFGIIALAWMVLS